MDVIETLDIIGLKDGIKKCFISVFSELNVATEVWFQKSKLLTTGRDNYADYITNKVGVFPLFATSRNASIDTMYVRVGISSDIERERYRSISQIETAIKRQRTGRGADDGRFTSAITPLQAIEATKTGFALIGNPGSGKTTAFRYLAVYAAQGKKIRKKRRIPIYLAARDLAIKTQGIIEASTELFKWLDINEAEKVFHSLLKSGNCILLLDGIDETSKEHQAKLLEAVS